MPTQLPRRSHWMLAVSLTVVLAMFAPAKPPDLPVPVQVDAAPADNPSPTPILDALLDETVRPAKCPSRCGTFAEGLTRLLKQCTPKAAECCDQEECESTDHSMADRCAAMRTATRCVLFSCHPLTAFLRLKPVCNFDEEAPFPVVQVGSVTVSVRTAIRGTALAVTSGPFCPLFWRSMPPVFKTERTATLAAEEEMHAGKDSTDPSMKAQDYMIAAEIYGHMGFIAEACRNYEKVCKLCPDSCMAWEAESRLATLRADKCGKAKTPTPTANTKATQTCPYKPTAIKKPVESVDVTNSVLEKLQQVERAADLYSQAEDMMHEGELEKARKLYEEICTLCPGHRFADMATDRLGTLKGLTTGAEEQEKTPSKPVNPDGAKRVPSGGRGQVQVTYSIADLILNNSTKYDARAQKKVDVLIACIKESIHPQSWEENGGSGVIILAPHVGALVVRNDLCVQKGIANLLEALRYLADIRQVSAGELLNDKNKDETRATLKDPCFPGKQHTQTTTEDVAEEQDVQTPAGEPKPMLSCMGYDITSLLTTYEVAWDRQTDQISVKHINHDTADDVVSLICKGIEPKSWYVNGGSGTIEFNAELKTLFVQQTADVHEAIAPFLEAREKEIELRKENVYRLAKMAREKIRQAKPASRKKVVPSTGSSLKPHMPEVNSSIVRAYNEILNFAPARISLQVHETNSNQRSPERLTVTPRWFVCEEECDENTAELKSEGNGSCMPSFCLDVNVMRDTGALRVRGQLQAGPFSVTLLRDPKSGGTLTLGLVLCTSEPSVDSGPIHQIVMWAIEQAVRYDRIYGGIE